MMKLRRRNTKKNQEDREYLVENEHKNDRSKIRRWAWKFAKGTWKAFKIGFQSTISSQPYCVALEPTAVATTIIEYKNWKKREYN